MLRIARQVAPSLRFCLAFALILLVPCSASADLTGFYGKTRAGGSNRTVKGAALSVGRTAKFEFEYATTQKDLSKEQPQLTTYMLSSLIQSPNTASRMQLYGVTGVGKYRETLGAVSESNYGFTFGAGMKMRIAGPIGVRVDYRIFTLRGTPTYKKPQRLYAGLNLTF
jgi:hypothetical protein